jgi:hypothetical protein
MAQGTYRRWIAIAMSGQPERARNLAQALQHIFQPRDKVPTTGQRAVNEQELGTATSNFLQGGA